MVTTFCSYEKHAVLLAKIAIKYRLFVSGWGLNSFLHHIVATNNEEGFGVSLVVLYGIPVAVAVELNGYDDIVYVFVRKKHRNKGYGRLAVGLLVENFPHYPDKFLYGHKKGVDGCDLFFNKCGLDIFEPPENEHDT